MIKGSSHPLFLEMASNVTDLRLLWKCFKSMGNLASLLQSFSQPYIDPPMLLKGLLRLLLLGKTSSVSGYVYLRVPQTEWVSRRQLFGGTARPCVFGWPKIATQTAAASSWHLCTSMHHNWLGGDGKNDLLRNNPMDHNPPCSARPKAWVLSAPLCKQGEVFRPGSSGVKISCRMTMFGSKWKILWFLYCEINVGTSCFHSWLQPTP